MNRLILCLAVSVFMFGCGGKHVETVQLNKSDMQYKNVSVSNFTAKPNLNEDNPAEYIKAAQDECLKRLASSNLFDSTTGGDGLIIQGEITRLKIVSTAARVWAGPFAGDSKMSVMVKVTNSSGKLIAEKEISKDVSGPVVQAAHNRGKGDRNLAEFVGGLVADYVISVAKKQ